MFSLNKSKLMEMINHLKWNKTVKCVEKIEMPSILETVRSVNLQQKEAFVTHKLLQCWSLIEFAYSLCGLQSKLGVHFILIKSGIGFSLRYSGQPCFAHSWCCKKWKIVHASFMKDELNGERTGSSSVQDVMSWDSDAGSMWRGERRELWRRM